MSDQTNKYTKYKNLMNRKIILGVLALIMGLAVICLYSFIPYAYKPENIQTDAFKTDLLIICSIVVTATMASVFIGQASNAQNPKSRLAKATAKFLEVKDLTIAKGLHAFKRWIQKVQQPNDIQTIKEHRLMSCGIEDLTVLKLNLPELKELIGKPQMYDNVPYAPITEEQYKVLKNIKEKGIKLELVPPEYYLSVKGISEYKTRSERAINEGKKKTVTLIVSIITRVILTTLFTIIFALFVKDETVPDKTTLENLAKLFYRLWSFITSIFMGYIIGCQINDIDAEYITMRVETQQEFLEDKEFKVMSVKEEAKEMFISRMQEEQRTPMIDEKTSVVPNYTLVVKK